MRKRSIALVAAVDLVIVVAAVNWARGQSQAPSSSTAAASQPAADPWDSLDAQARCDSAGELVRRPNPWPTICRWRAPGEVLHGLSFPPPTGDPPWERPRIEIFVAGSESRIAIAHAIAHELGHMHHTREARFGPQWLEARGLAADTPATVWTEDYAEVFATLYGPPVDGWQAPTTRPSPSALAKLESQFFVR